MQSVRRRVLAAFAGLLLAAGGSVAIATSANAANECRAEARVIASEDYFNTYQRSGTCHFHKIQGHWLHTGSGDDYYLEARKTDVQPQGGLSVGYSLSSLYVTINYRACTDTGLISCQYSGWKNNTVLALF